MIKKFTLLMLLLSFIVTNNEVFSQDSQNTIRAELKTKMFKARKSRDYDSTIYYLNKLKEYNISINSPQEIYNTKLLLFDAYVVFEKRSNALELGLTIFNDTEKEKEYLNCSNYLRVLSYLSDFMVSIKNYKEALNYLNSYKTIGCDIDKTNSTDYLIANVLIKMELEDSATLLMDNYVKVLSNSKITNSELINKNNQVGLIYKCAYQYDKAINHFNYVLLLIDSLNINKGLRPTILGNIGDSYMNMQDLNEAYAFLIKDSEGSLFYNSYDSYYNAELDLAKIDYASKRYSLAIKRLENLINSKISFQNITKEEAYILLTQVKEANGDIEGALTSLRIQKIYSDSLAKITSQSNETYNRTTSNLMYNAIKDKLKSKEEKRKREKLFLLEKIELKKNNTIYLSLIFILIVVILILYLRKTIIDKGRNELIKEQEIKISNQKLKLENEQRKLLEVKVDQRNKRITNQALELESKKLSANRIIENFKSSTSIPKSELLSVEIFVQNELEIKSIRGQIQSFIGDVGEDYIENLKLSHPLITDKEVKLSIMVLLKLSNKEIAISQNSTPNTIKTSKNRLKKKLELSSDISLYTYLFEMI